VTVSTNQLFELPLRPMAQRFTSSLLGRTYRFTTQYRDAVESGWLLDVADVELGAYIQGIPLVTGLDLLWQYRYFEFGFGLFLLTADGRETPTYESLGVTDRLMVQQYGT
jgi:hypothetical protein